MRKLVQDLLYALRLFGKYPIITCVVILVIAVGIGINTAIFTVINGVLLRPLPFDKEDRLAIIYSVSVPDYLDWKEQNDVFDGMAAYVANGLNLTGGREPRHIEAARVSDGYFQTLGVAVQYGRAFSADDHRSGAAPVVILSYALWQDAFGRRMDALGQSIQLGGEAYTVIGITPPAMQFPTSEQALVPYQFDAKDHYNRGSNFLTVIGRLKKGKTLAQAQAEFTNLNERIAKQYHSDQGRKVLLYSVHEQLVRNVRPLLLLLQLSVILILLIACANIANLLIALAGIRSQELGVRLALGASRSRVARQLFTESAAISIIGCLMGLFLGTEATKAFLTIMPTNTIPEAVKIRMDAHVFLFALSIAAATSVVFGVLPMARLLKTNVDGILKQGRQSVLGVSGGSSFRRALAVSELALSLLLLIASGLTLKSFHALRRTDPGFVPEGLFTFQLNLPPAQVNDVPKRFQTITDTLNQIEASAPVMATVSVNVPLEGKSISGDFHISGRTNPAGDKLPQVDQQVVGPRYFQTMGIPILRGRDVSEFDNESAPKVTLVSKALADKYFTDHDPIGQYVAFDGLDGRPIWMQIVGVVGDVKSAGLDHSPSEAAYVPLRQVPPEIVALFLPVNPVTIIVRTSSDYATVTKAVRAAVYSVDYEQPISEVRTMNSIVMNSIADIRLESLLVSTFAAVAIFLATVGVYAVMNSLVQQRKREIGLRMAFGANRSSILRMVITEIAWMALIAVGVGLLVSFLLLKTMSSWLYGAKTHDLTVFVIAPMLLFGTAVAACFIPALRASLQNPMEALRVE